MMPELLTDQRTDAFIASCARRDGVMGCTVNQAVTRLVHLVLALLVATNLKVLASLQSQRFVLEM